MKAKRYRQTDGRTDGRTDGLTDRVGHRVACTRLKANSSIWAGAVMQKTPKNAEKANGD